MKDDIDNYHGVGRVKKKRGEIAKTCLLLVIDNKASKVVLKALLSGEKYCRLIVEYVYGLEFLHCTNKNWFYKPSLLNDSPKSSTIPFSTITNRYHRLVPESLHVSSRKRPKTNHFMLVIIGEYRFDPFLNV